MEVRVTTIIDRFTPDDIDQFLRTCASEGSVCDKWELEFLLRTFPQGCFVCKDNGQPMAFVTSIAYGTSGWLGNLIVSKDYRGRGLGKMLAKCVVEVLMSAGVRSIWLSATEAGKGIYQGLGFVEVDRINQWVGFGRVGKVRHMPGMDVDTMISLDRECWGDRRTTMVDSISRHGRVMAGPNSFLVISQWDYGLFQLGPWVGNRFEVMEGLLSAALVQIGPNNPVFSCTPFRNVAAATLLASNDLVIIESSALMCLGSTVSYVPKQIFGFAGPSLG
jgi:ribosomal protein S18 acetylase RimI-like enzyme